MALRAASSLMSYTGPGGCSHARPTTTAEDGTVTASPDWILECGGCEASLAGHELWGPGDQPAPLTVDEIRLRDAQQADATRNVWSALAAMPESLAQLAMQNQMTMQILLAALQNGAVPGLPAIPLGELQLPALTVPAAAAVPVVQPPAAVPQQDAKPAAAKKAAPAKTAAAKKTAAPRPAPAKTQG